jgi:luciferase-like monooxygenase
MRFGVFLLAAQFPDQDHSTVLDSTVAAALAAEEAGFDDVWVAEHHFMSYGICPSAITLAGYLLGATRRITVGTAVSVLSTQHPVALAEQAALLDQLSGGRFRLGIGRGGPWIDLEVFGTGMDRYQHGFAESLDLLLAALSRPRLAACGSNFRFRFPDIDTSSPDRGPSRLPRSSWPLPRPPPWSAPPAAACRCCSACTPVTLKNGSHRTLQPPNQRWPPGPAHRCRTWLGLPPRWLGPGLRGYRRADGQPYRPRNPDEYTELLWRMHLVGTPEHCLNTLTSTICRTGIDHVILLVEGAGDRARTLENIIRLGAEILPLLHGSTPATSG